MSPLETLLTFVRTTAVILTSLVIYQQCSTDYNTTSNLNFSKKEELYLSLRTEKVTPLALLKNDNCGLDDALLHNFPLLHLNSDFYDSRSALIIHPGSVETRTHRLKGSYGHIGYDLNKGLYFRDESTQEQSFFKEGYVPNGDLMACNLIEKLSQVQLE